MLLLAMALLALATLGFILSEAPRFATLIWFIALVAVPYWAYLPLGPLAAPAVDLLALISLAAIALGRNRFRFPRPATPMLVFTALAVVGGVMGGMPSWYSKTIILSWAIPFYLGQVIVGRFGTEWLTLILRRVGLTIASAAIVEFILRWHPFTSVAANSPVAFWSVIQTRGVFDRSELTFGHSIALGGTIALLTPFVVGTASPRRRIPYTLLMVAGVVSTLSRGAMLATAIALILVLLFHSNTPARRRQQLLALILVALVAVPVLSSAFRDTGVEVQQSTAVRSSFLRDLTGRTDLFETSSALSLNENRQPSFDGYSSIDNAFLLIALESGLLALAAFVWLFVKPTKKLLQRNGSLADVSMIAMVPLLASVALITQWQSIFFLVAGAAYAWPVSRKSGARNDGSLISSS